jgi:hypothetical protein
MERPLEETNLNACWQKFLSQIAGASLQNHFEDCKRLGKQQNCEGSTTCVLKGPFIIN